MMLILCATRQTISARDRSDGNRAYSPIAW
jgi:hypothetical protein